MNLKKWSLTVSGLTALFSVVLIFIQTNPNCYNSLECNKLMNPVLEYREYLGVLIVTFFFFFFFFSCVTYFMRKEVFRAWLVLGLVYVPVSIIKSFNTPSYDNAVLGNSPSLMSIFIAVPFIILSILVIIISHFYYKKKDKN